MSDFQTPVEKALEEGRGDNCGRCWACLAEHQYMILCVDCGNKRCPKANDHRNECTGSNDLGQPGSAYEHGAGAASAQRWAEFFGRPSEKEEA